MLRYRGREGYWAWLLHRVSGLGIVLFLVLHVVDTSLFTLGPEAYETFVFLYRSPPFRVLEVVLAAALLYHGLNGVRIIVTDLVDLSAPAHRRVWYIVWAIFLIVFIPTTFIMLRPVLFSGVTLGRLG